MAQGGAGKQGGARKQGGAGANGIDRRHPPASPSAGECGVKDQVSRMPV